MPQDPGGALQIIPTINIATAQAALKMMQDQLITKVDGRMIGQR